ncbi:transglutaminase family protein [Henriciella sp. AS95]|uniref:transglutaminase-like domain-containing protein n=1 Tax=Henriciella sp. AS95 TaxID=3135782 RepID=UPI003177F89A
MRVSIQSRLHYHFAQPADVLLAVEALDLAEQVIVQDALTMRPDVERRDVIGGGGDQRAKWIHAEGDLEIDYTATVDVTRIVRDLGDLPATPRHELSADVVRYLFPSRYCEADQLVGFAMNTFGDLSGGAQATAMADWVFDHLDYVPGSSTGVTSAADTFMSRQGVCRDYAHLFISFARAMGLPARMVSVYAPGIEPPDFHAIADVWLDGAWQLIDPSRMSDIGNVVRIASGRDATDISFMTIFGTAELKEQSVHVTLE